MNETTRYVIAGVAGLVIGGGIAWGFLAPHGEEATCPFVPQSGSSADSYGFYLADTNGHVTLGTIYFTPGGFKHNIAFFNPAISVGGTPLKTYDLGPPCTGMDTAILTMTDSSSGQPVKIGTATFNSSPSDPSATYGITVATMGNGILPVSSMSGDAYRMK